MAYQRTPRPKIVPKNCQFCNTSTEPSHKDIETLRRFVTERGKILAHTRTGVCSKHQRGVALVIKYARHLALLPFVNRT